MSGAPVSAALPNSPPRPVEIALLPGVKHAPQREAPDATLAAITGFVARALRP